MKTSGSQPVVMALSHPGPAPGLRALVPLAVGLLLLLAGEAGAHGVEQLLALANWNCVNFKVLGPCLCGTPPKPTCVQVEYWEPRWLVETVKRPGETHVDAYAGIIKAAAQKILFPGFESFAGGGGGAGVVPGTGQVNLQYNETHVFTFPLKRPFVFPCDDCRERGLSLHYLSELDFLLWRTEVASPAQVAQELLSPGLGTWGPLVPRVGFAIHASEPVGSGIAAFRGLDIANNPEGHVIVSPSGGESRCCQLTVEPVAKMTPCFPVGLTPLLWEQGAVHPQGWPYWWIYWRKRSCCVKPTKLCGPKGMGMNQCELQPQLPEPTRTGR